MIERFMTGTYTVIRSGPGTYVRGHYVPGEQKQFLVKGSLQPANPRELKLPEEGNRLRQYWKFYSDLPIAVNSMNTLADSDHVIINGESYRAMSSEIWQGTVDLPYFKTILWREPEQADDGKGAA